MDSKPDILGVRGPQWTSSVILQPGKHTTNHSQNFLSNTLTPDLLNSQDVRRLTGTTACKADRHAGTPERTLRPSCEPGGWNTSVQMASTQVRVVHTVPSHGRI